MEETGVILRACEAANISRIAVWNRRQNDSDFAARFNDSLTAGALLLEAEAIRRAKDGVVRMKFNPKTGQPYIDPRTNEPYMEHEFSDTLMGLLLKRHFPNEYKEKPAETHVSTTVNNLTVVPVEQLKAIQERRRMALEQ